MHQYIANENPTIYIICSEKMGFIPSTQSWFNMLKSINITHIYRPNKKSLRSYQFMQENYLTKSNSHS